MSEIYRDDLPGVDEMRLREIADTWESVSEAIAESAYLGMNYDEAIVNFVMVMAPEMIQELGRRLRENGYE